MKYLQETLTTPLSKTATLTGYILDNSPEMDVDRRRPAVIILPGGGYEFLSDREAEPVAIQFAARGFQAFVLRYSVAPARFPASLLELAQAVATVRQHAAEWHVLPDKIVIQGFSAGAHLAASLGVFWNSALLKKYGFTAAEIQPNGLSLAYPVITSGEFAHEGSIKALLGDDYSDVTKRAEVSLENQVTPATPPTFLWCTYTDGLVPMENSLLFAGALRKANVSCELHVFPEGDHGLSLANAETQHVSGTGVLPQVAVWPDLFTTWMHHVIEK
ncbi:alpha/beta hydrolase [Lapidilactobacillus wuchangensis]|uniref:alpha/beta hydrolase n=1 Tax=Lapidilactobacillus wuchangensis TaxID=2486001 RepID=UPI000F7B6962|nr:alpha/beta hydrolase [Lapidilactobacillus wuchangensis]